MNKGKAKTNDGDVSIASSKSFLGTSVQLILLSVAGLIVFKTVSDVGVVLYTFHPTLMAVGYLILMVQGILAVSGQSIFADHSTHNKKISSHWIFQTFALVLITIAQTSIYVNKNLNGYAHYQSIHSYFGLATYVSTVIGAFGGTANMYSNSLKGFIKPIQLKVGHAMAGSVVYVVAVLTICLGINQTWTNESDAQLRLGTIAILMISSFYVIAKSIKTALSRLASMSKK